MINLISDILILFAALLLTEPYVYVVAFMLISASIAVIFKLIRS